MTKAGTQDDIDILQSLQGLETSHVSDALDSLGINGQCVGLLPVARQTRLVGRAFTVRYAPVGTVAGSVGDYIDDLAPGTVVTLDNAGRLDATVWGDILTHVAATKRLAGTVIDGVCRDTDAAVDLSYPVYSRSRTMRTGKDRVQVEAYNGPISIAGVRVQPEDYLLGDADGVVVIPQESALAVVERALAIRDTEDQIREAVRTGTPLAQARTAYHYHSLQTRQESPTGAR